MQLSRRLAVAASVLAGLAGSAFGDDPPPPVTAPGATVAPAPTPAPTPAPDPDAPTPDELRDVFAGDQTPAPDVDAPEPPTGTVRVGAYSDSDKTTVIRTLGVLAHNWGAWSFNGTVGIDAVTSASVDVRSSPALSAVDVVTTASGRSSTSGGQMTDKRYQATAGGGWKDSDGHALNLSAAAARETDYSSLSGGINGSYDILDRNATLLGGVSVTDNWVSSVLDSSLHRKMLATGWSGGLARVLTRDDAIRIRYDGKLSTGYLASPYRSVRFGDWNARLGDQQITFMNTIGSTAGLPEKLPGSRLSHAATLEWVHSLALGVALHPELRVAHDDFGISSLGASLGFRIARPEWRLQARYRYYQQTRASFFEDKYTKDPSMYAAYTSDKELGEQRGHLFGLDLAWVLVDAEQANDTRMLLNLQLEASHYVYPGFVLLPSRDSVFASIGLSWEL